MCVVCSCVVGWVVVVVVVGVASRFDCLSLFPKSISLESYFEPSCAVVSQVVSLVSSLMSLLILVGCTCELMSSAHLLGSLPCFGYRFGLVNIAGFQLEISFAQHTSPSRCLTIIVACLQCILFCLTIHEVIPVAASKSYCSHCAVDPRCQFVFRVVVWNFVERVVAVRFVAAFFLLIGVLGGWVQSSSSSAISSTLAACAAAGYLHGFLFVCMIILIIRRCVVWVSCSSLQSSSGVMVSPWRRRD